MTLHEPEGAAAYRPTVQVQFRLLLPPLHELVVQHPLLRRRDVTQGSKQLAAFGDVRFHDFRLRQQALAQISGQGQIGAPIEERADSVKAAAMLLAHLSHRLLAQQAAPGQGKNLLPRNRCGGPPPHRSGEPPSPHRGCHRRGDSRKVR